MLHDALDITTGPVAIRWPRTPAPMVADDEVGSGLSARLVSVDDDASVCLVGVGKMLTPAVRGRRGAARRRHRLHRVGPPRRAAVRPGTGGQRRRPRRRGLRRGRAPRRRRRFTTGRARHRRRRRVRRRAPAVRAGAGHADGFIAQGRPDEILAEMGLDAAGIAAAARQTLR